MKISFLGFTFFALSGLLGAASIDPAVLFLPNQSYTFSGACRDCFSGNGNGTGTLTVTGTYSLGATLDLAHFVSFSYDGTDLIGPFTITAAQNPTITGGLPTTLPNNSELHIFTSSAEFQTLISGFWCVGCANDDGNAYTFAPASATPEPASLGLLTLGFMGVALRLRKRS